MIKQISEAQEKKIIVHNPYLGYVNLISKGHGAVCFSACHI